MEDTRTAAPAGALGTGKIVVAAIAGAGSVAEDAGGELDELEDVASGGREVLDFVLRDGAGDGGGGRLNGGSLIGVYIDRSVVAADGELNVDGVGLVGGELDARDDLLLEVGRGGGKGKVVRRQGVEVIDAAGIGGGSEDAAGVRVGEGKGGVGNDRAFRVGDGALDGGAELRVSVASAENDKE